MPKGATLGDLIDKYTETFAKVPGKTKAAKLAMLKREIGKAPRGSLSAFVLRNFIDRRLAQGAGSVTIAAGLSTPVLPERDPFTCKTSAQPHAIP